MFVGVGILASAAGATTYIQFNAPGIGSGGFVVELNDNTPLHRDNFLRYVNGGLYVNQIIHRSDDANQVIQGGGFALSDDPDYLLQYVPVLDPPVTYEGNLGWSNTLYTLGAARTADPNSATNQWYINMGDNSAGFDDQPGTPGYTVFGRLVGGYTTADAIYAMPVWNAASFFGSNAFSTLPLLPTFDINGPLEQEHFVTLPTTQVITGGSWLGAAGTPWQTPGNWSCYMAPIAAFTTTFDAATVSQPALTQAESVKQVRFVTAGWTISGGANVLTVGDGGIVSTPATDSNAISAAVTAGASANWTVNNTLTLSGTLNLAGKTITKDGGGTLVVSGTQNHAASSVLNANAGNVVFNTDAGGTAHNKNLTVNVNGNAAVSLNSTEYLAGLNVNTGSATLAAGGTKVLVTNALTVDTTDSSLDITNNRLIVDYAPADANPSQQIQNLVRTGYNRG
ncbi:MAG: peptidylprolyl isomerase, partial [Planctomycetes bacterium]|nr:peptidylprolyl isomerase [Planctomycetota bacterium]